MAINRNNNPDTQNLYNQCKRMMNYHVVLTMQDGSQMDGIIESMEPTSVNVLVGEDAVYNDDENQYDMQRQYANPSRYRRFRRRNFPLANLLALSLLPYPYYAPPYSYYPYYPYSY